MLKSRELEAANLAADDLLDYWETRVRDDVIKLERYHDLLRIIAKDIKEIRSEHGLNEAVIQRFYALLTVNEIHSRDEERLLF